MGYITMLAEPWNTEMATSEVRHAFPGRIPKFLQRAFEKLTSKAAFWYICQPVQKEDKLFHISHGRFLQPKYTHTAAAAHLIKKTFKRRVADFMPEEERGIAKKITGEKTFPNGYDLRCRRRS